MVQYDRDFGANQGVMDHEQHLDFDHHSPSEEEHMMQQRMMRKAGAIGMGGYHRGTDEYRAAIENQGAHHAQTHPHPQALPYSTLPTGEPIESPLTSVHMHNPVYHSPPQLREQSWGSPQDNGEYSNDLVGQLRVDDLKIDDTGVGRWPQARTSALATG